MKNIIGFYSGWIVLFALIGLSGCNVSTGKKNDMDKSSNEIVYHTGAYRNLFLEAGYSQEDIAYLYHFCYN